MKDTFRNLGGVLADIEETRWGRLAIPAVGIAIWLPILGLVYLLGFYPLAFPLIALCFVLVMISTAMVKRVARGRMERHHIGGIPMNRHRH